MTNHPNRAGRPTPTPAEVRAARESVGYTQSQAAKTVHVTLGSWQRYEQGDRRMPPGLRELFSMKTGAPVYAIYAEMPLYDNGTIYAVGESIGAALQDDADAQGRRLIPMAANNQYSKSSKNEFGPELVVDLTNAGSFRGEDDGMLKMRRCSVRLWQHVLRNGGDHCPFIVTDDGMLDLIDDDDDDA